MDRRTRECMSALLLENGLRKSKDSPLFDPNFREIEMTFALRTFLVAVCKTLLDAGKIYLNSMNVWRYFTPDEANRMLPLVRVIVRDIQEKGDALRSLGSEGRGKSPRFQAVMDEIAELVAELEDLGCFYRDGGFQTGLVVFPALINGQIFYLCWQSDEPSVSHYHRQDEGFAGRRRIPPNWYAGGPLPLPQTI